MIEQSIPYSNRPGRPFRELSTSGLLWLINAAVFHPRGYALGLAIDTRTGEVTGWHLLGDGSEPWSYADPVDDRFSAANATFEATRGTEHGAPRPPAGPGGIGPTPTRPPRSQP